MVYESMRLVGRHGASQEPFEDFVARVHPRLLQALVATYGPVDGREAAVDALSWAWEHWDRVQGLEHQVAYLYRVGQSATRRFRPRPPPEGLNAAQMRATSQEVEPGLVPALARLSPQKRTVVLLVHGYGWRQAEVARLLKLSPSTVQDHLARAVEQLRNELEVHDVEERR